MENTTFNIFRAEQAYSDALVDLENAGQSQMSDEDRVLDYITVNLNPTLSAISQDCGIKAGRGRNPQKAPLNQILIALRDAGKITASNNTWGEPRFSIITA